MIIQAIEGASLTNLNFSYPQPATVSINMGAGRCSKIGDPNILPYIVRSLL